MNGLLLILIFGIPIFFTSVTRSVFEVNKLLLLRVTTLLTIGFWAIKSLLVDYDKDVPDNIYKGKPYYELLGIKWYKTGLEIPLLLWSIINIISTLLSRNIFVSVIGAYDRWEGIITVVNYVFLLLIFTKLVDSIRFFYWIIFAFIVSASMSAIYGILQSNGIDFMRWSADATTRAFGSINNPVHYGPYIGMMITLSFAYLVQVNYFKDKMPKLRFYFLYYLSFVLTLVIFFAMFLSWGRATWLGFQGAMTFFLLFMADAFHMRSKKAFISDFLYTVIVVGMIYILVLFNFWKVLTIWQWIPVGLLGGGYILWVKTGPNWFLNLVERLIIIISMYSLQLISTNFHYFYLYAGAWFFLIFIHSKINPENSVFVKNKFITLVLICFGIIVVAPKTVDFLIMLAVFGILLLYQISGAFVKDKFIRGIGLGLVMAIALAFMLPHHSVYMRFFGDQKLVMNVLYNAQGKINSYKSEAIEGRSPRMSMWKSGIKWGMMNPLFGTGPDTIKEIYPFYRRVEYARLEGGHNLTPDRLHNEYVNTLATTGILGFIARYFLVFGVYIYLMLNYLYRNVHRPSFYLLAGTLAGVIYYQGQVLFNFGVVATASLNYQLMGLGLAIGYYGFGNSYEETSG